MRLGIVLELKDKLYIPSDYRKHILSLIKESLKISDTELFNKLYGNSVKNVQKPFTFSVSFYPENTHLEKGKIFLKSNKITLHFSSFDLKLLIIIYNGFVKLSKKDYLFYLENEIKVKNFYLQRKKEINSELVTFKTLSPIVVRDLKEKKGIGFIDYTHPDFKKNLFYNVRSLTKNFLKYELSDNEFRILDLKMKAKKVSIYGKEIANKGILTINAPIKVLKLIYDAGLGAKRSQGWGMLEVVE